MRRVFIAIAILVASSTNTFTTAYAKKITGVVYHDANKNAVSYYEQELDPIDILLSDVNVSLLSDSGELNTTTSDYGTFSFDAVEPGTYLIDLGFDKSYDCTSNNSPFRIAEAIREGHLDIVAIGDSIGVMGSDKPYPIRLAEHFAAIVDTTVKNLAVGGSASWDWLPDAPTGYFDERLAPELADADVLTITLGGNDLVPYAPEEPPYDPIELIKNFLENPQYILEAIPNIKKVIESVKRINPNCDVVYVIYPNFGNSSFIKEYVGELQPIVAYLMEAAMSIMRHEIGKDKNIVIADMLGALGDTWLDPYLVDAVHPNDAGHQLYADVIFLALGGVLIGEQSSMGTSPLFGFDAPDLVPSDDDSQDDASDNDIDDDDEKPANNSDAACGLSEL